MDRARIRREGKKILDVWSGGEIEGNETPFYANILFFPVIISLCEKKLGGRVDEHPRIGFLTFNGLLTCPKLAEITTS